MARACQLTSTTLSAVLLSASLAAPTSAQGLDIGGVELHLGQDATEAVKALSLYRVVYVDELQGWMVSQTFRDRSVPLGSFYATNGKVIRVEKAYDVEVRTKMRELYTRAWKEVQRRGGSDCNLGQLVDNAGTIGGFEMQCGQLRLRYFFAMMLDNGTALDPNLTIILGAPLGEP